MISPFLPSRRSLSTEIGFVVFLILKLENFLQIKQSPESLIKNNRVKFVFLFRRVNISAVFLLFVFVLTWLPITHSHLIWKAGNNVQVNWRNRLKSLYLHSTCKQTKRSKQTLNFSHCNLRPNLKNLSRGSNMVGST